MSSSSTALAWRNWAGNQQATASAVARPESAEQIAQLLASAAAAGQTVKPIGSGHSFTATAATTGTRIELSGLAGLLAVDPDTKQIRVRGGTPLSVLNAELARHGLAMPNLGDIDVQTITGALATGTHGTGKAYGCLSTFLTELELVTGTGEIIRCSRENNPDIFSAAQVGVGALGVITEVTLRGVDAFVLHADEQPAALAETLARWPEFVEANDHFEFFWMPYTDKTLTKKNNRVPADDRPRSRFNAWLNDDLVENTALGAAVRIARAVPSWTPAIMRGMSGAISARNYTERSDLVFTSPRRVRFVEMEYGLPREAFPEAFAAVRKIIDGLPDKISFPVECRFTAADDIWLSTGHGRDNAYIAIHQFVGMPYERYFRAFEAVCAGLGGRPHWGKLHYRTAEDSDGSPPGLLPVRRLPRGSRPARPAAGLCQRLHPAGLRRLMRHAR
jgi:FAD-linked oxidoreductase